jgi:cell wall-associated NlpC family hydrolase
VSNPLESAATSHVLRVRTAVAPMLGEPRIAGGLTSQLTAGHLVTVLEVRDNWRHVRGEDGYTGWMHEGYLEAASGDEAQWRVTTGAQVHEAGGCVRALPFGARVTPQATVIEGTVYSPEARAQQFPSDPLAICRTAESRFVGASYVWGAVTPWGCDCSGFVQSVFRWHGVLLPRDAWQQAEVGQAVAIEATRPADLLFFSDRDDRRITHVAIVLPEHRLVHSALARGGVHVESLGSGDAYVQRLQQQCVGARRVV